MLKNAPEAERIILLNLKTVFNYKHKKFTSLPRKLQKNEMRENEKHNQTNTYKVKELKS